MDLVIESPLIDQYLCFNRGMSPPMLANAAGHSGGGTVFQTVIHGLEGHATFGSSNPETNTPHCIFSHGHS
jgi:hypothetical protein